MRIGFLPLSKGSWMNPRLDGERAAARELLRESFPEHEIIGGDEVVAFEPELLAARERFRAGRVDCVVFQFLTFSLGTLVPLAANDLRVPSVLWSVPEPPMTGGRLAANSFCAANMNSHFLWKLRLPYFHVHAPIGEEAVRELRPVFSAVGAAARVRRLRLGVIGGRVPGFYTSGADEMLLRRELGVELKYITLLEVVKRAEALGAAETAAARELIKKDSASVCGPSESEVAKSAALYTAIRGLREKYLVDAFALRCWPEVNEDVNFGIGVCSTIGMLTNHGDITACEGDVYGAVTMVIQNLLSGEKPFFCDMIVMEGETGMAWHCGAAPAGLCRRGFDPVLRRSSIIDGGDRKGLTNEFPLRSGRVTLARLSENRDGTGFRMLIAPGSAEETAAELRGNPLRIRFDAGCDALRRTVIEEGFEHHYSLVHADITEELTRLCQVMNIDPLVVG